MTFQRAKIVCVFVFAKRNKGQVIQMLRIIHTQDKIVDGSAPFFWGGDWPVSIGKPFVLCLEYVSWTVAMLMLCDDSGVFAVFCMTLLIYACFSSAKLGPSAQKERWDTHFAHIKSMNHQDFQVPKMEVLNLTRLFFELVFPYISRIHTAYIGDSAPPMRGTWNVWSHKSNLAASLPSSWWSSASPKKATVLRNSSFRIVAIWVGFSCGFSFCKCLRKKWWYFHLLNGENHVFFIRRPNLGSYDLPVPYLEPPRQGNTAIHQVTNHPLPYRELQDQGNIPFEGL